jgi:hypothetical protein
MTLNLYEKFGIPSRTVVIRGKVISEFDYPEARLNFIRAWMDRGISVDVHRDAPTRTGISSIRVAESIGEYIP